MQKITSLFYFVVIFVLFFAFEDSMAKNNSASYKTSEIRSVETNKETQIRKLREQEITQIRIALGRRAPKARRADLYFRLAEVYLEMYQAAFFLEGRVHENQVSSGKRVKTMKRGYSMPFLSRNSGL